VPLIQDSQRWVISVGIANDTTIWRMDACLGSDAAAYQNDSRAVKDYLHVDQNDGDSTELLENPHKDSDQDGLVDETLTKV